MFAGGLQADRAATISIFN